MPQVADDISWLIFWQALVAELDPAGQDFSGFPNWTYSLALAAFLNDTNNNRVSAASEETLSRGARAVMLMPNVVVTLTARYFPSLFPLISVIGFQ